ncbi:hypothetical protein [Actinophytocola glycyrrhizae]|uniref:Uncharacterized protein n=1 Tax=Actinophytocola glycyrrhizae TaxID=2044873 RepID=A0ABV9S9W5_9PSEU
MTPDDRTPPHGLLLDRRPVQVRRDDTTRYLCAAAHLDPAFGDGAIREFLVEPTRPVSASPGVDAAAVLAEAVAARTRRKLRDLAVVLLLAGLVFLVAIDLLVVWTVLAVLLSLPAIVAAAKKHSSSTVTAYLLTAVVVVALLLYAGPQVIAELTDSTDRTGESGSDTSVVGAVLVVVLLLTVLAADRFVVWRHLATRFWPNRLTRVEPWLRDRPVFQFSPDRRLTGLRRYAEPRPTVAGPAGHGAPVPLVVYRGFVPFVGAGDPEDPWSIAVPLENLPDTPVTGELTTAALYAGINEEITSLRGARTLSPGRRLGELGIGEQVIVSADELIDHLAEPAAADFLTEPGVAPFTMLRRERADAIRDDPLEWARYYQCYQIETWDRDLVVTVFVHVAVGEGALYVEWTPCVLRPIRKKYRRIDAMSRSPLRPAARALLDLLALPASVPGRLVHLLSFLRPLSRDQGVVDPGMYGSATSLREMAADRDVHNYFQLADVDRYVKMLEGRLIRAVSRMMRTAGYSPASFDAQAAAVVNNNVQIAGSVGGSVVVGSDNKVGDTAAPRSPE